jgi:hypothetical protein
MLDHLTDENHQQAARLLNEVQNNLLALSRVVNRAPWTDRVMRVQKAVQERLIDPLSEARDRGREQGGLPPERDSIYPSVYYSVRRQ